jgi:hypothetical protein
VKKQDYLDAEKRYRNEVQPALDQMIEESIRSQALPNALAMVGVIIGAFLINLLLLVAIAG